MTNLAIKATEKNDEPVTDEVLAKAIQRGLSRKNYVMKAVKVQYLDEHRSLLVTLNDNSQRVLSIDKYDELKTLNEEQLGQLNIGVGGKAICLDECDLHMALDLA